ncbi:MAG: hypothetical protein JWL77_3004 [Chthonomonadaceae bacterium]|nr:hypothetical protein [Chthonomonadaceae bacterium]
MANVDLGNVPLVVGQQVKYVFTVQTNVSASVWLVSAGAAVVEPVAADGTPLTFPHELVLTQGVGTYFLQGVSSGSADYFFRASSDPSDTTNLARASVTVTPPPPQGPPIGEEVIIVVTSIAEPIIISIITQSPTNTASD